MAQKVTSFTPAATLDGTEIVPVIQGGGNRRTTVQDIADKASAASIIDDAVPAFDKVYSSNKTKSLVDAETAARASADTTLQSNIDLKLNSADYNDRYKGKYTTLPALQTAHPTSNPGDYAQVDAGAGSNVINYNWDSQDGWVIGSSVGPTLSTTDDLAEGSTHLYFTTARAIAAVDISGKVDKVAGKQLSTEDYTTAEKTKLAGIAAGAQVNDASTTLQGNTFNGISQLVKTDGSGKLPAIDGSQLTNLPAASISGTANRISITAGVIDISAAYVGQNTITTLGTIATGTWQGTAIASGYGGTGFSSYAKGDIIYASAANTLSKLAVGTDGYVLTLQSGLPVWAAASGGSGGIYAGTGVAFTSYAKGDLIFASAANVLSKLPAAADGRTLMLVSGVPSWVAGSGNGWTVIDNGTNYRYTAYDRNGSTSLFSIGSSSGQDGIITTSGATFAGNLWLTSGTVTGAGNSLSLITNGNANNTNAGIMFYGYIFTQATNKNVTYHNFNGRLSPPATGSSSTDAAVFVGITPTITYTGTSPLGGYIGLRINVTETTLPSGPNYLIQAGTGGATYVNKFGVTNTGQVIIGTATPNASAALQIESTTQGFLPSRMTTTQAAAIATPAEALFLYDTTLKKFKFWNGTAFEVFTSA